MKRSALISLLVIGLLILTATPGLAWHHGHGRVGVFIGVGPGYWGPYPYWWYPPPYYAYPPPYYPPAPVVVEQPPAYVEQQPPAPAAQGYWYYCTSAKAYYPNVQNCSEAWVKVPAQPQ